MKNKITILIISSILMLIALSSIQAYLIYNTYQLKKEVFIKETDDAMEGLNKNNTVLDSIQDAWQEDLKNYLNDYKNQRLSKADVVNLVKEKIDSSQSIHETNYQAELKRIGLDYDVKFKKNLNFIIITDAVIDTIYSSKNKTPLRLFGQDFKDENEHLINTQTTFTESEYIRQKGDSIVMDNYDLEVKMKSYILITDWKRIVYGRMAALFIGSVVLFLFVIGLLYYSIKNLVTQKKIAEIKTDFINNITHELKTPLATLSIATKSLKTEKIKNKPEAFDNTLNIVERQNDRLQKLIDQVMTNSLSSEDIVLNKEHVSDNEFFNHLIQDFKLSTQHHDLTIQNDLYPSEVLLRIDKFQFTTAILNILENAVKYGKDHTEIHLHSELKNGNYIIKIKDNGIGISEKNQQHVFDKFYRVGEGNVHDVKGLGLGMYYTSQIIKAHNGSISIDSDLNKGTTFTIKIPVN